MIDQRLVVERLGEVRGLDLRPLRHADLVEAVGRPVIVRARAAQQIEQVLGVAQIGEVGRRDDQDVVGVDQGALGPAGPLVRHVEHDAGHRRAQRVEDRIEGLGREVVDPVERGRRRQQAQVVGALRQQAVDEAGVDAIGREHRVGDALRRVLVEVEAGGAEGEIEIGHDGVELQVARDRPGDVVRDGRGADAALGADHRDHAADRLGVRRGEQAADRAHHVERADRRDQVVADAAPHQLAIEHDVVVPADHDHPGAGVADLGERVEAGEQVLAAALRFEHDDVRRRRIAVGLDRGGDAAHLDLEMRLVQPAVFAGGLDGGGGLDGFAERLDRDARRRRDVLAGHGALARRLRLRWACSLLICPRR